MSEKKLIYRVATGKDHETIYDFGEQVHELGFPTVVAEKDDIIIGYISTQPSTEQVVAGPMFVEENHNRGLILIRMMDFYGEILKGLGITQYRFGISVENERLFGAAERLGAFQYEGIHGENHIFKRAL